MQLCEGHNRGWQDLFRDQPGSLADIDVVCFFNAPCVALFSAKTRSLVVEGWGFGSVHRPVPQEYTVKSDYVLGRDVRP